MEFLLLRENQSSQLVAQHFINGLILQDATVAVIEGVSGGSVLDALTIAGSTKVFRIGCVAYGAEAKVQLGINQSTIDYYGEHAPEVAQEMAQLGLRLRNDTYAIATAGAVDQTGTSGYIYVACAKRDGTSWGEYIDIEHVQKQGSRNELAAHVLGSASLFITGKHRHDGFSGINTLRTLKLPLTDAVVSHARYIVDYLQQSGLRVGIMESCTGGALANALTKVSGAASVLDIAWVTYDEDAKLQRGVPLESMIHGSVYSQRVALAMAQAAMGSADIGIGTTGTMENLDTRPHHTDSQPGTVHFAIVQKGYAPIVDTLKIAAKSRSAMKAEVVDHIMHALGESLKLHQMFVPTEVVNRGVYAYD